LVSPHIPVRLESDPPQALSAAERMARAIRPGTLMFSSLPPLSLYVHLPWCLKKCPYCDFNSHEWGARSDHTGALPIQPYLSALRADLESSLPLIWGRRIHSIFIGGGTPSLFPPDAIDQLLADLRARLPLEPGCEITLEANPGTFERDRFRAYRQAGVTRLSVGVQSFDDEKLRAIGRVHDATQAHAAVEEARDAFDTFNIDLMYALPGQTVAQFETDLTQALAHAPPHLSIYHLTMEPNTYFAAHPPSGLLALPDEDTAFDMLDMIVERTAGRGLQRYEVSAFAQEGHRCAHNLNYWQFGDYLGIGAGAHSKLTFPHRVVREVRFREPSSYMKQAQMGLAVAQLEEIKRRQLPFEFMLNAMRLKEGISVNRYTERTALLLNTLEPGLASALSRGLIQREGQNLRPTNRGFDLLSDLQAFFLPSD
jgi:putative oxygen-independent coproporphyrinogen III oxidase